MEDKIREIKGQLRLYMNGVVSQSMRKKGLDYKLIFGVELPRLKEIAQTIEPSSVLAEALWLENNRECKILATMIYPKAEFTSEVANLWIEGVTNIELARFISMNLLQHLEYAPALCLSWIANSRELTQIVGYLTMSRLFRRSDEMDLRAVEEFVNQSFAAVESGDFHLRSAAMQALISFMQMNSTHKEMLVKLVEGFDMSENMNQQILHTQIKEEASYL